MWNCKGWFFMLLATTAGATTSPVKITLTIPKEEYYFCEPIPITYRFTNVSTTTILLPKQVVDYPYGNPDFQIAQEATGRQLYTLERFFPNMTWNRMSLTKRCIVLAPGETFSINLDLLHRYYPDNFQYGGARLDASGEYRVTLQYQNAHYDGRSSTFTVLRGTHHSNTVAFRLRPPNETERAKLLDNIHSRDRNVSRQALDSLAIAGDTRILPRLYDMLSSQDKELQARACSALGRFRDNKDVLARLHETALKNDTDWARMCATEALGLIQSPSSVSILAILCADDRYPDASVVAARILLMDYEASEHLDRIEAVMRRQFGSKGDATWQAKIRELRKKASK